jgi:hypothetical protein
MIKRLGTAALVWFSMTVSGPAFGQSNFCTLDPLPNPLPPNTYFLHHEVLGPLQQLQPIHPLDWIPKRTWCFVKNDRPPEAQFKQCPLTLVDPSFPCVDGDYFVINQKTTAFVSFTNFTNQHTGKTRIVEYYAEFDRPLPVAALMKASAAKVTKVKKSSRPPKG